MNFGRGAGFGGCASQKAIDPIRIATLANASIASGLGDQRRRVIVLLRLVPPRAIAAR
ncbi:hypothetical protein [Sphingomonas chungangi]|uniref:hypothetical protein n=1 Tax=Sphingomonas chungangi TaxID=2683589 RepID=UPI001FECAD7F|nr:hypothetical protein [Sphingomonas chungangi]